MVNRLCEYCVIDMFKGHVTTTHIQACNDSTQSHLYTHIYAVRVTISVILIKAKNMTWCQD